MSEKELIEVSHVSKRGSSLRITLPKKIIERLDLDPDDIVTFIEKDVEVILRKMELKE